ncbi:MAG: methyltransferase domain-containing protein [Coriobacteriales bacterium]|nr:methyltransferase domain-containing protein [Coriobacteriales bacterium]
MNYAKADSFPKSIMLQRSMGPNPLKMCEELLTGARMPRGSVVLDLGSGAGLTSALMAREYGFVVYAADLWSNPSDNMRFFESVGLTNREVIPLKADANALPFAHEFFDAVVSVDSYNYFGRDPQYLGTHLLPLVKRGGTLLFAIPGMTRDCHDNLPACLLRSWTAEQLDYMHDMTWWRANIEQTAGATIVDMHQMCCTKEAWADWLECDNEYARNDRAAVEAGALDYLNTITVELRRN